MKPSQIDSPHFKFNTCKFRSEEMQEREIQNCCSVDIVKGYYCQRRDLFRLFANTCLVCPMYEKK